MPSVKLPADVFLRDSTKGSCILAEDLPKVVELARKQERQNLARHSNELPPAIEAWVEKFPKPAHKEIRDLLLASFNIQAEDVAKLVQEQERQRVWGEALLSSRAQEAARLALMRGMADDATVAERVETVIRAALDALEDSDGR